MKKYQETLISKILEIDDYQDLCNLIADNQDVYKLIKKTLNKSKEMYNILDDVQELNMALINRENYDTVWKPIFDRLYNLINKPTKTAKEMFKELGYKLSFKDSTTNSVIYRHKETKDIFVITNDLTYVKVNDQDIFNAQAVTYKEHQAITQQLKELQDD